MQYRTMGSQEDGKKTEDGRWTTTRMMECGVAMAVKISVYATFRDRSRVAILTVQRPMI